MRRIAAISLLILSLAMLAGCGGDSDSGSSATQTDTAATTETRSPAPGAGKGEAAGEDKAEGPDTAKDQASPRSQAQRQAAREAAKIKDTGGEKTPEGAKPAEPKAFVAPAGGDNSIQTYGESAEASEAEEIVAAMRSFFTAMAALDYPAICAGLTEANRDSLQLYRKAKDSQGGCEEVLEELLLAQAAPEARKAANGSVLEARVQDGTAFVLFTPEGGSASYFVMKNEDGWKATGLAPGTPFDPAG